MLKLLGLLQAGCDLWAQVSGALEVKGRRVDGFSSEIRNQTNMISITQQGRFTAKK